MSKIKRLSARNIKSIKEIDFDLKGCSAIIMGKNNCGKSTLLNILRDGFKNIKPEKIVRQGEQFGVYEVELMNDDKITWEVYENGKEFLVLTTKDGNKKGMTRELLHHYLTPSFDIDKFLLSSPKDQRLMLQKLVGLDFTAIDAEYKLAYEKRTYANKQNQELAINASGLELTEETEPVDITRLQSEIQKANDSNAKLRELKIDLKAHLDAVKSIDDQIELLNKTIDDLIKQKKEKTGIIECCEDYLDQADVTEIDINNMVMEFNMAVERNKKIQASNKYREQIAKSAKASELAKQADLDVKAIETRKKELLKTANLPKGITFSDDGVLVDGLPLDKNIISTSKKYITAVRLASRCLGDVKCITMDAAPLDKESLEEVQREADELDLQILIEKPDYEGGEIRMELREE
jgi:hypothetical protein